MKRFTYAMAGVVLLLSGCAPQADTTATTPPNATTTPSTDAANTGNQSSNNTTPELQQPIVAETGVGKRVQETSGSYGAVDFAAVPVRTLFQVRERAVFEIQIPQAMQLFNATEGRNPKSHEEFMDKIISANRIKLPELPAGQEYRYHPDDGQLWVHPAEKGKG